LSNHVVLGAEWGLGNEKENKKQKNSKKGQFGLLSVCE